MRSIPVRKLFRARSMRRPGWRRRLAGGLVERAVHKKDLKIPAALDRDLIDFAPDFRLTFAQLDRRHALDRVARRQVQYRPLDSEGDCRSCPKSKMLNVPGNRPGSFSIRSGFQINTHTRCVVADGTRCACYLET